MKKALLVVDIQNDFCSGGALEVGGADEIFPTVNKLIDEFNKNNDLVVATIDWHPADHGSFASNSPGEIGEMGELNGIPQIWWPDHCVQGSIGAELHKDLKSIKNKINKGQNPKYDSYSSFFDANRKATKLNPLLKENDIDTLYIVGLATDYCVKFTVLDALELGYNVYLVENGCRGVNLNPSDSKEAVKEMKRLGAIVI
ncbi:bifunctional nicotinamidase/pyrazinamidase [Fusobacteria bacterium ZRK30]|nr:bifunctional nicotinamidase/pyrazinamidase [Fusobacteria bacterium ZRK30]